MTPGIARAPVLALAGLATAWCVVLVATPIAAAGGLPHSGTAWWAAAVYEAAGRICHQRVERSFLWGGVPFPVCGRCLALYLTGAAGLVMSAAAASAVPRWLRWPSVVAWRWSRWTPEASWLAVAALPSIVLLAIEWTVADPGTVARAGASVPLGLLVGWICGRGLARPVCYTAAGMGSSVAPARVAAPVNPVVLCALAWAVPGAGHVLVGKRDKAVVFFLAIVLLFSAGLWFEGRIFPFELSQPLVALAALADLGVGIPYFVAWVGGFGAGAVLAPSYEYANTYLIVAGLLNALVVLDAFDIAVGRKG